MMNSLYYSLQNFRINHYNSYAIEIEYTFFKVWKRNNQKIKYYKASVNVLANRTITFKIIQLL